MQNPHDSGQLAPLRTDDGTTTLVYQKTGVAFRSQRGARTESQYVFVDGSELIRRAAPWRVLELGLGTGMNFLETAKAFVLLGLPGQLDYHALEPHPISPTLLSTVHAPTCEATSAGYRLLQAAMATLAHDPRSPIQQRCDKTGIALHLYPTRWQETILSPLDAHAIYHDPFGPKDAPDCWTTDCFRWASRHLASDGLLVTYSAAGHVRRAMAEAGFLIGKRPGASGKREMTAAALRADPLAQYKLWRSPKAGASVRGSAL